MSTIVDEIPAAWDGGGVEAVTKTADLLQKMFGRTKVSHAVELVELNIISDAYKQGKISKTRMIEMGIDAIKQHQVSLQERRVSNSNAP